VARVKDSVERYRIGLEVVREPLIQLSAYVGPLLQRFAKPIE
jgi:hypothetical protein